MLQSANDADHRAFHNRILNRTQHGIDYELWNDVGSALIFHGLCRRTIPDLDPTLPGRTVSIRGHRIRTITEKMCYKGWERDAKIPQL
jgi:hypothetical protein